MEGLTWTDFFDLFGFAVAAALAVGLVCPLVGNFLLVRRTGFYGVTLPQFAAAGVAFGFAVLPWAGALFGHSHGPGRGFDSHEAANYHLFWAAVFTFGGLALLVSAGKSRGTEAGWMAASFSIAVALTILCAQYSPDGLVFVEDLLHGRILAIGLHEFETLAGTLGAVLCLLVWFYRDILLISFDSESARVLGKPVRRFELLFLLLVGASVSVGVMTVGPVVLFGLLVIPPLAARGLARSMASFQVLASILGLLAAAGGLWASFRLDWPLGPAVVVAAAAELALVRLAGAVGRTAG